MITTTIDRRTFIATQLMAADIAAGNVNRIDAFDPLNTLKYAEAADALIAALDSSEEKEVAA